MNTLSLSFRICRSPQSTRIPILRSGSRKVPGRRLFRSRLHVTDVPKEVFKYAPATSPLSTVLTPIQQENSIRRTDTHRLVRLLPPLLTPPFT
jgi:hypothetical protein